MFVCVCVCVVLCCTQSCLSVCVSACHYVMSISDADNYEDDSDNKHFTHSGLSLSSLFLMNSLISAKVPLTHGPNVVIGTGVDHGGGKGGQVLQNLE